MADSFHRHFGIYKNKRNVILRTIFTPSCVSVRPV